jgi:septum formation protein
VTLQSILLASSSPRRKDFLRALGIPFRSLAPHVDESLLDGEDPFVAAERLARAKATAAALAEASAAIAAGAAAGDVETLVIAADTLVVLEGRTLGKPADRADARAMLRALSGRRHEVVTGVALVHRGTLVSGRNVTAVLFAPLDDAAIERCVESGEADDKAGAYALQGLAGFFIDGIEGSPSNVVGLPVRLLYTLAARLGVDLLTGVP